MRLSEAAYRGAGALAVAEFAEDINLYSAPRRRRKSAPERDRALLAIDALWPDGVPSLIILRNCTLCKEVAAWLKKRRLLEVKDTRF